MRIVRTVLVVLASASLAAACQVGGLDPDPGPGDDDDDDGGDPISQVDISGDITESATWAEEVRLVGDAAIADGVEITIDAGTVFTGAEGAKLRVHGSLIVEGTAAAPVTMHPMDGAPAWGGLVVEEGGSVIVRHVTGADVASFLYCHTGAVGCSIESVELTSIGTVMITEAPALIDKTTATDMSNGGVTVRAGGDLSIVDSYLFTSTHDIVVATGGSLTIDHSEIGGAQGSYEHCDLHIGAADSVTVTNSNIISGVYGIMLGNSDGAVFNNNNFLDNDPGNDVLEVGPNTNVDLRLNYWDQGAPALGADYDTSEALAEPVADAGPRS